MLLSYVCRISHRYLQSSRLSTHASFPRKSMVFATLSQKCYHKTRTKNIGKRKPRNVVLLTKTSQNTGFSCFRPKTLPNINDTPRAAADARASNNNNNNNQQTTNNKQQTTNNNQQPTTNNQQPTTNNQQQQQQRRRRQQQGHATVTDLRFFWGVDLENAAPTDKVGLGGRGGGGGGEIGPSFDKAILLFLVYVCKNGFRVGFGHVGVQKTVVLVAKNGLKKMKFFGRRSVFNAFYQCS